MISLILCHPEGLRGGGLGPDEPVLGPLDGEEHGEADREPLVLELQRAHSLRAHPHLQRPRAAPARRLQLVVVAREADGAVAELLRGGGHARRGELQLPSREEGAANCRDIQIFADIGLETFQLVDIIYCIY